ncbi:hypothetical protein SDC9_147024 [bioreactor metagenome]|uniref:Uncharacterized protein n=1 Tax=bioreactor metagenome TaxID=1076179 RepID=A0A645EES5_9ZZZZ
MMNVTGATIAIVRSGFKKNTSASGIIFFNPLSTQNMNATPNTIGSTVEP